MAAVLLRVHLLTGAVAEGLLALVISQKVRFLIPPGSLQLLLIIIIMFNGVLLATAAAAAAAAG